MRGACGGPDAVPPGVVGRFYEKVIVVVDVSADFLARRIRVSDLSDVGREKKDLEIMLFVNWDRATVFFGLGRQNEGSVWMISHLAEFLLD